jgi:hypothetical protein
MPYLQRTELDPVTPVPMDMSKPMAAEQSNPPLALALESDPTPAARRKYFADESHRKEITFTPQVRNWFSKTLRIVNLMHCPRT